MTVVCSQYADTLLLPVSDPYHPWELRWLNRWDTIPRYMRAAKWNLDDAKKRIQGTLEWRREFQPDLIPPAEVKIEAETGKMYVPRFSPDPSLSLPGTALQHPEWL